MLVKGLSDYGWLDKQQSVLKSSPQIYFKGRVFATPQLLLFTGLKTAYLNYGSIYLFNIPAVKAFFLTIPLVVITI
ncbi:MAG TPA: hypothetical protein VI461_15940 [Chitinophagaceae bacterium]|nr:hypothetical protein [Chitinophagaceae bacterium]